MLVKDRMTRESSNRLSGYASVRSAEPNAAEESATNAGRGQAGLIAGIVAEKDLLYASPSPATSLNVYDDVIPSRS